MANKWYSPNQLFNPWAKGKNWIGRKGLEVGFGGISLLKALSQIPMKEGGRVTKPKGVGKATCGYGKAMRNKRK